MCVPITLDVEKGACTGGSKTVGFHYVRIVGGDCWNVSFIQWSDVGTDLWKSRECGYGECQKYFFFSAISYPFIALYDDGSCILRAQENSRLPMLISVISNILNIILNLLFVWVFHWGVAGSATATMLARMFSMVTVLVKLRNPQLEIQLRKYFTIRPDWDEIKRILRIGVPSGVENSMFQFGKLAIQSTVSLMGTAAIAAQGMASIIENLNGIMGIGIGIGLMTVVGETLGAGRKEEAVYYVKKLCIVSEVVIIASCLLLYALVRPITYFGGMEPESAKMCILW